MTQFIPVTTETCGNKYWNRYSSYRFIAPTQFASVVVGAELSRAMHTMPLVFIRQENMFHLVALLSPLPGDNLFVSSQGKWLGQYVPACFRSYPFKLAVSQDAKSLLLYVDKDSGLVADAGGEAFFDGYGQLSKPIQGVFDFMKQVYQNELITQQAVTALSKAGVIVPWPLTISIGGKDMAVSGVHRIDEEKLNGLEEGAFLSLRKAPAFQIAYAQLFSMVNTGMLSDLAQARAEAQKKEALARAELEQFFGKDDTISFSGVVQGE